MGVHLDATMNHCVNIHEGPEETLDLFRVSAYLPSYDQIASQLERDLNSSRLN